MEIDHAEIPSLALQACASCRTRKRKCDKQLPHCGLCVRVGRRCDYSTLEKAAEVDELQMLKQRVADLESLIAQSSDTSVASNLSHTNGSTPAQTVRSGSSGISSYESDVPEPSGVEISPAAWHNPVRFPSFFFLDSFAFDYGAHQVPKVRVSVPPGALTALGTSQGLRSMIEEYFLTVHTYFPVVSKLRLYQHLVAPSFEPGADTALLFLAMKLLVAEIPPGVSPRTQFYHDAKALSTYVEAQNGFSVQMVQALLLIALYETGNSIYPAAYLTTGHAARVSHAMGLHDPRTSQMSPKPRTWTEQEERRRVGWGIVILDRFVNLGHRGKPFASDDPSLDAHLPTDDDGWDSGQMLAAAPISLSASQTVQATPFARTCQASHFLGRVERHLNDRSVPLDYLFEEALQLDKMGRSLLDAIDAEAGALDDQQMVLMFSATAICHSALLTLYDGYSCTSPWVERGSEMQLQMKKLSIAGLGSGTERVLYFARKVRLTIETHGVEKSSPFILDALYQAAANCEYHCLRSL